MTARVGVRAAESRLGAFSDVVTQSKALWGREMKRVIRPVLMSQGAACHVPPHAPQSTHTQTHFRIRSTASFSSHSTPHCQTDRRGAFEHTQRMHTQLTHSHPRYMYTPTLQMRVGHKQLYRVNSMASCGEPPKAMPASKAQRNSL